MGGVWGGVSGGGVRVCARRCHKIKRTNIHHQATVDSQKPRSFAGRISAAMLNTPGMLPPTPNPPITRDTNSTPYTGVAADSRPKAALMASASVSARRRPHASEAAPNTRPPTSMPTKMAADSSAFASRVRPLEVPASVASPSPPQLEPPVEPSRWGRMKDRHSSSTASAALARPSTNRARAWKRPKPRWLISASTVMGSCGSRGGLELGGSGPSAGTCTGLSLPYMVKGFWSVRRGMAQQGDPAEWSRALDRGGWAQCVLVCCPGPAAAGGAAAGGAGSGGGGAPFCKKRYGFRLIGGLA